MTLLKDLIWTMFPSEGSTVAWPVSLLVTNLSHKKINETHHFLLMFPLINKKKPWATERRGHWGLGFPN